MANPRKNPEDFRPVTERMLPKDSAKNGNKNGRWRDPERRSEDEPIAFYPSFAIMLMELSRQNTD